MSPAEVEPNLMALCREDTMLVIQTASDVLVAQLDACAAEADRCGAPSMPKTVDRVRWMADAILAARRGGAS